MWNYQSIKSESIYIVNEWHVFRQSPSSKQDPFHKSVFMSNL